MTAMSVHKQETNKIIDMFETSIKHPYLQKYLKDPSVDIDQAAFLQYMLEEKKLDPTHMNQCIIATLLVQAALDTHEKVNNEHLTGDLPMKERQLTVLAGDYYSSLYYYILSKMNDVTLIEVLAKSIQQINESKMNIYKDRVKRVRATVEDVKVIESKLLTNIAEHHLLPDWGKLAKEFFYFKRLVKERNTWMSSGVKDPLIRVILKDYSSKEEDQFATFIEEHISLSKERLDKITSKWDGMKEIVELRVKQILQEEKLDKLQVMGEK